MNWQRLKPQNGMTGEWFIKGNVYTGINNSVRHHVYIVNLTTAKLWREITATTCICGTENWAKETASSLNDIISRPDGDEIKWNITIAHDTDSIIPSTIATVSVLDKRKTEFEWNFKMREMDSHEFASRVMQPLLKAISELKGDADNNPFEH